ncbi:MAG: ABC transporter permease [Oscillospiraceae bacterium]|nr:ABC transporter permease [Oscillospiraceae bacterium]
MKNLLRKELSELLNKQMLLGLLVSFILIVMLGTVMTSTMTGTLETSGEVHIIDLDQTDFTKQLIAKLQEQEYTVKAVSDTQPYEIILSQQNWDDAAVLPAGMTDLLLNQHKACEINSVTALKSTSTMSLAFAESSSAEAVITTMNSLLSETYLKDDLAFLEKPVSAVSYTVANNKSVQANSAALISSLAVFDQFMPLVLFLLIVLTSQTIITAVAAEKTDKTLETLLASPVPRSVIIGAKMLAALITALIYALVYGGGFLVAMLANVNKTSENIDIGEAFTSLINTQDAIKTLGLQIPFSGWIGVILQLLLTIGIALTASMILGGLVEDAKGSQTASIPILVCTMFPYILSMVSDIRGMGAVRYLLYCIPFTHTFIATSCLRFHDTGLFLGGMAYQILFLAGMAFFALKLYQSDILFTHRFANKREK